MNLFSLRFAFMFIATTCLWAAALLASSDERTRLSPQTELDRYVARPDTNYTWRLVNTIPGDGYATCIIEMVSQAWLTTNEVNRTRWQHWLVLVKPEKVSSPLGLLFIGGGSNKKEPPAHADDNLTTIAKTTGTVVAELRNVPNEPLLFAGDNEERTEDGIIAYTWDK